MGVSVGSSIYNAPSIYESGSGGGGGGGEGLPVGEIVDFPAGFTPLEKIEFTGKFEERIIIPLTGYRQNNNTTENTLEFTGKITNTSKISHLCRYLPPSPLDGIYYNAYGYCIMYSNGGFSNCFTNYDESLYKEKFSLKYKYNKVSLNNHVENKTQFTTINTKTDVYIGAYQTSGLSGANYFELYSYKIYDPNENMIFFGVPAFDEANEVDGLLDLITNEFFKHEWTT